MARLGEEAALTLGALLQPCEHLVQRPRQARDLVVAFGLREPTPADRPGDLGRPAPHRLDRPQSRPGERVPRERGEQQGDGTPEKQLAPQVGQRLVAVLERGAGHHDPPGAGAGQDPYGSLVEADDRAALSEEGLAARSLHLGSCQQRRLGRHQDEALVVADAATRPERSPCLGTRAQRLLDLLVERSLESLVEVVAREREHGGHHDGEDQASAEPAAAAGSWASVDSQSVAGAADGLDRLAAERAVDLLAQVAHVHVDHVRPVLVVVVPGVLQQLEAREHPAGAPHEGLQDGELLRRELDVDVAAPHGAGGRVEREVADLSTVGRSGAPRRASARRRASSSANANGLVR